MIKGDVGKDDLRIEADAWVLEEMLGDVLMLMLIMEEGKTTRGNSSLI
jgi:hypothetical protein